MTKKKFVPAANGVLVPDTFVKNIKRAYEQILTTLEKTSISPVVAIEALFSCIMYCNFKYFKDLGFEKLVKMLELHYNHWRKICNPTGGH
jgi:hypothetical protein